MEKFFVCEESNVTFETIKEKKYYPDEKSGIQLDANLLLIPYENLREKYEVLFPEHTTEILDYFQKNANSGLKVDIVADDDTFKKIELHDASILFTPILVNAFYLPLTINLISSFIYDFVKKRMKKPKDINVKMEIYCEETKTKKTTKITYEGPSDKLKESLEEAGKLINGKK